MTETSVTTLPASPVTAEALSPLAPIKCAPILRVGRSFHRAVAFDVVAATGPTQRVADTSAETSTDGLESKHDLESAMLDENYYEILGLGDLGCNANDDQIKKAYRKLLLKHHPDKKSGTVATPESDPVFLAIQKAYDTLSEPSKRRSYDSQFDFDDSIPSGTEKGDFFKVYGPVFLRNARFSANTPAPLLGDASTPYSEVQTFYRFWREFDSWREFSQGLEHDPDDAEYREEKRWMERQNAAIAKKKKKKEVVRVATLVDRAYARDPRILKEKENAKKAKLAAKEAKAAARRAKEDAKLREVEEAKRKEEERIAAEKAAAATAREQKKKAQQLLRAQRRALRQIIPEDLEDKEKALIAAEYLIARMNFEQLTELNGKIAEKESPEDKLAYMFEIEDGERYKEDGKRREALAAREAEAEKKRKEAAASVRPWTEEELTMLAKGIAKFPGGSRNRWQSIAQFVNTLDLPTRRNKGEIIAKANSIEEEKRLARAAKMAAAAAAAPPAPAPAPAPVPEAAPAAAAAAPEVAAATASTATPAAASASTPSTSTASPPEPPTDSAEWSAEQQTSLETALSKYPASMEKNARWKAISAAVPGRTKKECIQRFKVLRERLLAKK